MNFKTSIFTTLTLCILGSLGLTGCIQEDLQDCLDSADALRRTNGLVFDIAIPAFDNEGSSSPYAKEKDHGEEWETFIDQAKFRVLFFDNLGNFLFQVDPQFITLYAKGKMADGLTDYDAYRVNMPRNYLFDEDRDPRLQEEIVKAIMEDGFKVAVLANWPNYVEGPRQYDFTNDEYLNGEPMPTNLNFVYDPSHTSPNSKIDHLSHCIYDNVYGNNTSNFNDVYKPLIDENGNMGVYSSWVSYLYTSQRDAESFIRAGMNEDVDSRNIEGDVQFQYRDNIERCNCDGEHGKYYNNCITPSRYTYVDYGYQRILDEDNKYDLENIWRLWNFSAGTVCPYLKSDPKFDHPQNPNVFKYWHHRNQYVLIEDLNAIDWTNGNSFDLKDIDGESLFNSDNTGCKYVPVSGNSGGYLILPPQLTSSEYESLTKGSGSWSDTDKTNATKFYDSSIHFKAYGEGILKITAKGNCKIAVISKFPDGSSVKMENAFRNDAVKTGEYYFDPNSANVNFNNVDPNFKYGEFMIDPSSQEYRDVYIAAIGEDGQQAEIYEIEYMRARHIYDSARNAIMPSSDYPIPMYGIQHFAPIKDYIMTDFIFNLSDKNENTHLPDALRDTYPFKFVYLLRSVAKVELRFKKSVFKNNMPEHVMMRVMNRTARCEPMDVINPTEWIWFGSEALKDQHSQPNSFTGNYETIPADARPNTFVGADNEFYNIIKFGPLHQDKSADYKSMTTWFYGNWAEQGSNPATNPLYYPHTPWPFTGTTLNSGTGIPYPRIFNTRIDRSDYCRFHRIPNKIIKGEEYICYLMYSPEKNIDDADTKGDLNVRPKVQHIELRFTNMNDVMNFDDSDCYWIYFTDYSANNGKLRSYYRGYSNRNGGYYSYDDAESYDPDFLKLLQPVLRNCHYVFTINSINDEHIGVNLSVCGAAPRQSNMVIR